MGKERADETGGHELGVRGWTVGRNVRTGASIIVSRFRCQENLDFLSKWPRTAVGCEVDDNGTGTDRCDG